jgi:hypothetical protein
MRCNARTCRSEARGSRERAATAPAGAEAARPARTPQPAPRRSLGGARTCRVRSSRSTSQRCAVAGAARAPSTTARLHRAEHAVVRDRPDDVDPICHMSSSDAVEPAAGKRLYGWLSPDEAKRLGAFLRSKTVTDCMQLILNGDVVDVWICPHDVRPPSPLDVLDQRSSAACVCASVIIRVIAQDLDIALPPDSVCRCYRHHARSVMTLRVRGTDRPRASLRAPQGPDRPHRSHSIRSGRRRIPAASGGARPDRAPCVALPPAGFPVSGHPAPEARTLCPCRRGPRRAGSRGSYRVRASGGGAARASQGRSDSRKVT